MDGQTKEKFGLGDVPSSVLTNQEFTRHMLSPGNQKRLLPVDAQIKHQCILRSLRGGEKNQVFRVDCIVARGTESEKGGSDLRDKARPRAPRICHVRIAA